MLLGSLCTDFAQNCLEQQFHPKARLDSVGDNDTFLVWSGSLEQFSIKQWYQKAAACQMTLLFDVG
jgi:hypothetical protein